MVKNITPVGNIIIEKRQITAGYVDDRNCWIYAGYDGSDIIHGGDRRILPKGPKALSQICQIIAYADAGLKPI